MKYISHEHYGIQCPKCNGELMLEKARWSELKGSLYYIFCPCCNIKGDGANDKETALANFHKELSRKEKLALRKPKKILTDIRDYLLRAKISWKARNEILGVDLPQTMVDVGLELWVDKALADLTEYAEKLGVEL